MRAPITDRTKAVIIDLASANIAGDAGRDALIAQSGRDAVKAHGPSAEALLERIASGGQVTEQDAQTLRALRFPAKAA